MTRALKSTDSFLFQPFCEGFSAVFGVIASLQDSVLAQFYVASTFDCTHTRSIDYWLQGAQIITPPPPCLTVLRCLMTW